MWTVKGAGVEHPSELDKGLEVEKEHTGTINWLLEQANVPPDQGKALLDQVIKRIAEDHIKELPDYYTLLQRMESKL
jgi:hypothetical protein